jgi:pimeloyl-CoA synthetase
VYLNGGRGISDLFEAMCMSAQELENAIREELFPMLYSEEAEYEHINIKVDESKEGITATFNLYGRRLEIISTMTGLPSNEQEFKLFVEEGVPSDAKEHISFYALDLLFARVLRILSYSSE